MSGCFRGYYIGAIYVLTLTTLASGSSGNCILLSGGGTHLLIDAGISCRRITKSLQELGIPPEDLSGVLITHEHTDHVSGLATLTKRYHLPVYTSPGTGRRLCYRIAALEDVLQPCSPGGAFTLGSLEVETFSTLHDAAEPMGFSVSDGTRKAVVVTDLGVVTGEVLAALSGAGLVVVEANHDEDWVRSGPYPYYLKERILGNFGHLSNQSGAALALRAVETGARTVVLAHLSSENNSPEHARSSVSTVLTSHGIRLEEEVTLAVAPRSEPGPTYAV